MGFEAGWLAARRPYDDAALDRAVIAQIRSWAGGLPAGRPVTVVDLGSGTGAALDRAAGWLAPRRLDAYAVDTDAELLSQRDGDTDSDGGGRPSVGVRALVGDVLSPLDRIGGPPDGSVDLVLGHALADLLPLDRLAARVAALLRSGGLAHLALTYDGLTAFDAGPGSSFLDAELERRTITAFHQQMDRHRAAEPNHGGSTAGRRVGPALVAAGLEIVADGASVWRVQASDGSAGRAVLDRLLRYVVETVRDAGAVPMSDLDDWMHRRRAALAANTLVATVGHRDVLARRP